RGDDTAKAGPGKRDGADEIAVLEQHSRGEAKRINARELNRQESTCQRDGACRDGTDGRRDAGVDGTQRIEIDAAGKRQGLSIAEGHVIALVTERAVPAAETAETVEHQVAVEVVVVDLIVRQSQTVSQLVD